LITAKPGIRFDNGRSIGFTYLIWKRSSHTGMIMGTPGALFGWSCLDDDVDMAAPEFDLYCSGTIDGVNASSAGRDVAMARIDLRGQQLSTAALRAVLPRGGVDVDSVLPKVRPIVDAVMARGAVAALEYGETFDGVRPATVRVPVAKLAAALAELGPDVRAALEVAIDRTRRVHADQRRTDTTTTLAPGATVTERWVPVERVGLYVPGGNAVYPSSVVMNVVPAQTAGVDSLVIASPPQVEFGGLPHPTILAAAALLGVDEVWAVGGAQAVALLAFGGTDTDGVGASGAPGNGTGASGAPGDGTGASGAPGNGTELAPVDMITGPGNIYVTAAKRICRSQVGIDAEAGPTEIAILADHSADPVHIAADLISQAEHDEMAASVLVTTSEVLADATDVEVAAQLQTTLHRERVTAALTGRQSAIVLVDDVEAGIRTVNAYAAEHLEIQTLDAPAVANQIRAAGAIFVGAWSPVSLGDYCAGSNHVLPTAGCARHSSGLSVQTFLRGIHVVDYTEAALKDVSGYVITLAKAENLPAHGEAVRRRFER
jgi:histidinol dehydrogenase